MCEVRIFSAVAIDSGGGTVGHYDITGFATECTSVIASVEVNGAIAESQPAVVGPNGGWSASVDTSNLGINCGDQRKITIRAVCTDDTSCSDIKDVETVVCQSNNICPLFEKFEVNWVRDGEGGCNPDGTRQVNFFAELSANSPYDEPVLVEFVLLPFDGGPELPQGSFPVTPGELFTDQANVPAGIYGYALRVVWPQNCTGPAGVITVPFCPGGDNPEPASCPIPFWGPVTESEECNEDGERTIQTIFTIQPVDSVATSVNLVLRQDGAADVELGETNAVTTETDIPVSINLAPGTYRLEADITAPSYCQGGVNEFVVSPCTSDTGEDPDDDLPVRDPPQDPPVEDPPVEDPPVQDPPTTAQPPAIPWCAIMLWIGMIMMGVGAVVLGIAFCLIGFFVNPYVVAVFAVIGAIGAILLILGIVLILVWLALCGSCRQNCVLLDILIDVLLFAVMISGILAVIGGIISMTGLSALCFLGWLIDLISFSTLLFIAVWWSRIVGCSPWPRWVPDWARFRLPDFMRFVCGDRD